MPGNQKRILEMLSEKKISVEEAERLLSLIGSEESGENISPGTTTEKKSSPRYLRVVVRPGSERDSGPHAERVNVRVPLNLIQAGMKLTALIPPPAADKLREALKEKGVDFDLRNIKADDIEELIEALSDLEVDVESGREKVRVYVE